MSRPVILLLSASRRVIIKARALGLDVVHVEAPTMSEPSLAQLCLRTERHDLSDVAGVVRLARALHAEFGFVGVLSNHEPASVAAEEIALDLGLIAPGKGVAALLRDKVRTRELLDGDAELRTPWAPVCSSDDIRALGEAAGYPLVVKPRDGSASIGIAKVNGPEDVAVAWARARETLRNEHRYHEVLPVTGYLAEPFVAGEEYSVETFTVDGRHEVCAVVRKIVDAAFVETGHVTPAGLDAGRQAAVTARVRAFLDRVGLREGPAHTEVIVGATGVYVIESHARTGGDEIPGLVRLVTGRDVEADMIAHFAGLPLPAPDRPIAPAAAKLYLVAGVAGRLRAVTGRAEALALPGVRSVAVWADAGDEICPPTASWERLGEVIAVGPTPQKARSTAQRARDLLTIRLEQT
jgi:biotin carboxylase